MLKAVNIQDHTTAFVKKELLIPFLLNGMGFIGYVAKNTGRAQLITKILGDEPIGTIRSMPLRGGVVLELDIFTESITVYERTQQNIYFPLVPVRKELMTLPFGKSSEMSDLHIRLLNLYNSYCYNPTDLQVLFAGSVFEATVDKLIKQCFYVTNKSHIRVRNVSFVENGTLLEVGGGVTYFRVKISPNGTYVPVLYRYELSKMCYYQSIETLENYKDPSFLCSLYEHHNKEIYILNNRTSNNALGSFYTESTLLTA